MICLIFIHITEFPCYQNNPGLRWTSLVSYWYIFIRYSLKSVNNTNVLKTIQFIMLPTVFLIIIRALGICYCTKVQTPLTVSQYMALSVFDEFYVTDITNIPIWCKTYSSPLLLSSRFLDFTYQVTANFDDVLDMKVPCCLVLRSEH